MLGTQKLGNYILSSRPIFFVQERIRYLQSAVYLSNINAQIWSNVSPSEGI